MGRSRALSRLKLAAALALGVASLNGCHPKPAGNASETAAITNRPQNFDRFIAILKLKTPALLSSASKVDGKITYDETLKATITEEQAQAEQNLAALSPDIQILYHYRMVLNALAVIAPKSLEDQFKQIAGVSYMEGDSGFSSLAPVTTADVTAGLEDIVNHNSGTFIGTDKVHTELKLTGKGVTVGVIDTGIDYTHAMFGGAGTPEAYTNVKPGEANANFPTAKVVGGIDLVGTDYDSAANDFNRHIPHPDNNPLDEAGHGSHVSGTIAGAGDGTHTYSGIAPDASLYALKVFGKSGSTGDAVIIEALELAADPHSSFDGKDHLDVVNLSLGSSFGMPHILYTEAMTNLTQGDTMVIASAGNSGANAYIVGAPSIANAAVSVAAGIDNMDHNWKFGAVMLSTTANPALYAEALEASFAKSIATAGDVKGKLVDIGLAAADLSDAQKATVKGNVALIKRGAATFVDKCKRANDAGAIGVVIVNNVDGEAFAMGGDGSIGIPVVMITKALGEVLAADVIKGTATISYKTDHKTEKPELVDTLTGFSSRGPRSVDGAIKPEIAAPGANVISAKMGSGNDGVQFSGTSMAAPHMTGVAALLKQAHPELDVKALKSLLMTTATLMTDNTTKKRYAVSAMGAGRVRAYEAATAGVVFNPPAISLGEVLVEKAKTIHTQLTLTNIKDQAVSLKLTPNLTAGATLTLPGTVDLPAHTSKTIDLYVKLAPPGTTDASLELDGFIDVTGDAAPHHIALLAVVNRTTRIGVQNLVVRATSDADAAGADTQLTLVNSGDVQGDALVFNLLGEDGRKADARINPTRGSVCDLESAGWRVVHQTANGVTQDLLQIAVKLYNPVTTWQLCEVSVLIDANGDGVPEQELLGTNVASLSNNEAQTSTFQSVLTDADKMRSIRHNFEISGPGTPAPNYLDAMLDAQGFTGYGHSTIAVVTADLSKLATTPEGDLRLKLVVEADSASPNADDYLLKNDQWLTITPADAGQAYIGLPDTVALAPGETKTIDLTKGDNDGKLVVYLPVDASIMTSVGTDKQEQILTPTYAP